MVPTGSTSEQKQCEITATSPHWGEDSVLSAFFFATERKKAIKVGKFTLKPPIRPAVEGKPALDWLRSQKGANWTNGQLNEAPEGQLDDGRRDGQSHPSMTDGQLDDDGGTEELNFCRSSRWKVLTKLFVINSNLLQLKRTCITAPYKRGIRGPQEPLSMGDPAPLSQKIGIVRFIVQFPMIFL